MLRSLFGLDWPAVASLCITKMFVLVSTASGYGAVCNACSLASCADLAKTAALFLSTKIYGHFRSFCCKVGWATFFSLLTTSWLTLKCGGLATLSGPWEWTASSFIVHMKFLDGMALPLLTKFDLNLNYWLVFSHSLFKAPTLTRGICSPMLLDAFAGLWSPIFCIAKGFFSPFKLDW